MEGMILTLSICISLLNISIYIGAKIIADAIKEKKK